MTFKRAILVFLTLVVGLFIGSALFQSLQEPQVQSRLDLYQTNIVLQASEWEKLQQNEGEGSVFNAIAGGKPIESAIQAYQEAEKTGKTALEKIQRELDSVLLASPKQANPEIQQLKQTLSKQKNFLLETELDLGLLEAKQGDRETAQKIWQELATKVDINPNIAKTARVLSGLWNQPPENLPNSQEILQANLNGWFRKTALSQLFTIQQRSEALAQLNLQTQHIAEDAVTKLFVVGIIPYVTGLIGLGLIIFVIIQRFRKGEQALLAQNSQTVWETPWDGFTILEVFVIGFFLMGQVVAPIVLPLVFRSLPFLSGLSQIRLQSILVFSSYLFVAASAIAVLLNAIRPFQPLQGDWFKFKFRSNWILWGLGGYCTAIPIIVIVSLLNQEIWQGKGGSNPLLQLVLDGNDPIALTLFFSTAAIAAPLFEEFLFRGFLLPSLTRYVPTWSAILLSSLIFAAAHLSISELLPLFALGIILGIVYTRSRNLLAPMLLHALWNSGTMLTLIVLGSGN